MHTDAVEALGHPTGRGAQIGLALGMSQRVGRIGPVTSEHVAHARLGGDRFPVRAGGLVGDGQCVGDGVLGERISSQFPVELEHSGDKRAPEWWATRL